MMQYMVCNKFFQKNIKSYLDFPNTCINTHTHTHSVTLSSFELLSDFSARAGKSLFCLI